MYAPNNKDYYLKHDFKHQYTAITACRTWMKKRPSELPMPKAIT